MKGGTSGILTSSAPSALGVQGNSHSVGRRVLRSCGDMILQQGVVSYMPNNSYIHLSLQLGGRTVQWVYSAIEYLTSPPEGRGSSTHRVCLCVCLLPF